MASLEPERLVGRTITSAEWADEDEDRIAISFSDGCEIVVAAYGGWGGTAAMEIEVLVARRAARTPDGS